MITYWVNTDHRRGMDRYLVQRGAPLARWIEIREYEALASEIEVSSGPHIFSALDQLTPLGRHAVAILFDQLGTLAPASPGLNDPRRVLRRGDLLNTLHREGINSFRACRADEDRGSLRYPVFVREESGHDGPLTGMLHDHQALRRALRSLRMRGYLPKALLIVEFCNLADATGCYRKAAAFKVGQAIIPAHLVCGKPWVLKWDEADWNETTLRANLEYVTRNPHADWLRRVFDIAKVDYGRCDYGVGSRSLEVWEINLNPTIGNGPGPDPEPLRPELEAILDLYRPVHHGGLQAAIKALEPEPTQNRLVLKLDPGLIAALRKERNRARRRETRLRLLRRTYEQPLLGRPLRMALRRFFPRI